MTHDIDDLLDMIRKLELRIIQLEKDLQYHLGDDDRYQPTDSYYWEHG